jgi:hypothetical protein
MIRDVLTVAWKEWRELLFAGGGMRGGRLSLVILLAMFGVFFFISLFMQTVLGYSALRAGAAFLLR